MGKKPGLGWEPLPWDSTFFGISIGRITDRDLDRSDLMKRLNSATAGHVRCLYWLADEVVSEDVTPHECRVLDQRLSYSYELKAAGFGARDREIRVAQIEDAKALLKLARASHTNTRFWEDPGFPRQLAGDLYAQWIQRALGDPESHVLVFGGVGHPRGYTTVTIDRGGGSTIGLVAVDLGERGSGWGQRLLKASLALASAESSASISVVTQGRNLAARHLYEGLGFELKDQATWVHFWLNGEHPGPL